MKDDGSKYKDSSPFKSIRKSAGIIKRELRWRGLIARFYEGIEKKKRRLLVSACCLFLFFLLVVGFILFYPFPYIGVSVGEDLSIIGVRSGSTAKDSGLAVGDVIIGFGKEKLTHFFDFERRVVRSDINDGIKLRVLSEEGLNDVIVLVEKVPLSPMHLLMAIISLLLIGFLLFILIKKKYETTVFLLFLISFFLALFLFLLTAREITFFRPFFVDLIIICAVAVSPLFLHLTYIFPKKRVVRWSNGLFFYMPALMAAAVASYYACSYVINPTVPLSSVKYLVLPVLIVVFLLYFGLGMFFLLVSFYTSPLKKFENQVKWFYLGIVLGAVPLILFFILLEFIGVPVLYYGRYDLFLYISFLFPLSIVFAITEYRLMDIDALLNRMIVYTLLVTSLVLIYIVLVSIIKSIFGIDRPISHTWVALIPVIIVGALYEPLRKWFQDTVDRFIFREKFTHLRIISEYSRNLLSIIDLEILLRTSLDALSEVMGIKRSVISLFDRSKRAFRVKIAYGIPIKREIIFPSQSWVRQYIDDSTTVVKLEPNPQEGRGRDLQLMMTLRGRDGILGIMGLSGKEKGELFSSEDFRLLETFSSQLSMAIQNCIMIEESRKAANTREAYGRFLSQALVDKIMSDPEKVELGGENLEVAILFCDLRDFTQTTDGMAPHDVVGLLNEYFSALTDVIFSFDGTLDKYIGDGIMALFGAPIPSKDDPLRAVNAARKMQARVSEINERRKKNDQVILGLGVGVDLGEVTVGNIGSPKRMEYTAIGDAVNLASRLVDKAGYGEILISSEVNSRIEDEVLTKAVGEKIRIKGKGQVQVYRVAWED
ncbi:MAG: GAF domain-containing protein [Deltaproteobacteria bacterium]|uniref:GAF domain-containing protein n=1 Tax=Candidatus Zymogenus saltonus TaxID=2844893 RepID=A0A9D8PM24_9DELT|nr:GAF domain-containing protein [Candidatus Zymogenus saltonus]